MRSAAARRPLRYARSSCLSENLGRVAVMAIFLEAWCLLIPGSWGVWFVGSVPWWGAWMAVGGDMVGLGYGGEGMYGGGNGRRG